MAIHPHDIYDSIMIKKVNLKYKGALALSATAHRPLHYTQKDEI